MSEYHEDDLVEATNEDGATIKGRLRRRADGNLWLGCVNWTFPVWIVENAGFSEIRVLEAADPDLPTEPGWYLDTEISAPYRLRSDIGWDDGWGNGAEPSHADVLVRLEPTNG